MLIHKSLFLIVISSLFLSACTQPAQNPKSVADQYWQYIMSSNFNEAEKLATTKNHHMMPQHTNSMGAGMGTDTQIDSGETTAIVNTTITTINPDNNTQHTETFNTVLVLQQGQWKVDVDKSPLPVSADTDQKDMEQLAEQLSESMQKNIESMDDAVNMGMQQLNEALRDGSKEMGDSLLLMMNELNKTMQESIEKMKQRREQQTQPQQQPDPRQGEGMI